MDNETLKKLEQATISEDHLQRVRSAAEELYRQTPEVHCPYFDGPVKFNVKGLDHIKSKSWSKSRGRKDQFVRFKFLRLAPTILSTTTTLQGYSVRTEMVRKKNYGLRSEVLLKVFYYEFIYVHKEQTRVKVIVKKEGENGDRYFYSIIPFWKIDGGGMKVLSSGNPEED